MDLLVPHDLSGFVQSFEQGRERVAMYYGELDANMPHGIGLLVRGTDGQSSTKGNSSDTALRILSDLLPICPFLADDA